MEEDPDLKWLLAHEINRELYIEFWTRHSINKFGANKSPKEPDAGLARYNEFIDATSGCSDLRTKIVDEYKALRTRDDTSSGFQDLVRSWIDAEFGNNIATFIAVDGLHKEIIKTVETTIQNAVSSRTSNADAYCEVCSTAIIQWHYPSLQQQLNKIEEACNTLGKALISQTDSDGITKKCERAQKSAASLFNRTIEFWEIPHEVQADVQNPKGGRLLHLSACFRTVYGLDTASAIGLAGIVSLLSKLSEIQIAQIHEHLKARGPFSLLKLLPSPPLPNSAPISMATTVGYHWIGEIERIRSISSELIQAKKRFVTEGLEVALIADTPSKKSDMRKRLSIQFQEIALPSWPINYLSKNQS